jgi:hypothetical protein
MTDFKGVGISRLEIGRRQIDERPDQTFALLEHTYLLPVHRNIWLMATVRDEPGLAPPLFHFDLGVKVRVEGLRG